MNKNLNNFETDWLFHFGLEFPRDKHLFTGIQVGLLNIHYTLIMIISVRLYRWKRRENSKICENGSKETKWGR